MKKNALNTTISPSRSSALVFTLPGILPEQIHFLLDQEARMAMLLSVDDIQSVPSLCSFQLTPSSTRVLLSLLQAYPGHCSHQELFDALFPLPQQDKYERAWDKNLAIRPIRRALAALTPALHAFSLQAISLRGRGYVLAAAIGSLAREPLSQKGF
jgi:hypothetical protein